MELKLKAHNARCILSITSTFIRTQKTLNIGLMHVDRDF